MNAKKDFHQKKRVPLERLLHKRSDIIVFICIFLLLFLGGYRFHFKYAFIFSFVDALYLMFFYDACSWIQKHIRIKIKKRFIYYLLIFILLQVVIFLMVKLDDLILSLTAMERLSERNIYHVFKNTTLVLGTYIAWQLSNFFQGQRQMEQLQWEKKEMELRMLRSQLNPHFIFNTLNNIYSLVYTHDEKAPESILQMAEMCRYVTDECQSDHVSIEKEIKYIQNYIDLQIMRFGEKNIRFEHEVDNASIQIPPMLLQPFIENCFNHGDISSNGHGFVSIKIKVEKQELTFTAINSKSTVIHDKNNDRDGIGIANVQQMLQYYYDNKYQLDIQDTETQHSVTLRLNLK